jgi:hypothetical protein
MGFIRLVCKSTVKELVKYATMTKSYKAQLEARCCLHLRRMLYCKERKKPQSTIKFEVVLSPLGTETNTKSTPFKSVYL